MIAWPCAQGQIWQVFDMANGSLPNNTVKSLAVAPNGDVWVGTEYGLCRYDGNAWQTFQSGGSGLADNDVRALAVDDTGAVWVGTLSGLTRYAQGNWTTYTTLDSPLPENYIRSLEVAPQGGIWVGTVSGLAWFDGDTTWHVYNDTPLSHAGLQLPGNNIAALQARADGLLCIGTVNAGFTYLTDTSVTVYTTFTNGLPDNTALGVALDSQGWRWLACPAGALLNHAGDFIGGAWYQYSTLNSQLPSNSLTCIEVDGWDRKLIGNQISGLTIFQGFSSFTTYNTLNSGLPGNEVMSLATDDAGGVWVGTSNAGVARFSYAATVGDLGSDDPVIGAYVDPWAGELVMKWPDQVQGCLVILLDMQGRVVGQWSASGSGVRIPLGTASTGAYVARVVGQDSRFVGALRVIVP
jgi:ligand-binding sensor domain-containing protein